MTINSSLPQYQQLQFPFMNRSASNKESQSIPTMEDIAEIRQGKAEERHRYTQLPLFRGVQPIWASVAK